MKKLLITTAIFLSLSMTAFADPDGGGLFQRGATKEANGIKANNEMPALPNHNQTDNQNAPLGSGAMVLVGLGAAYLISKRCKEE